MEESVYSLPSTGVTLPSSCVPPRSCCSRHGGEGGGRKAWARLCLLQLLLAALQGIADALQASFLESFSNVEYSVPPHADVRSRCISSSKAAAMSPCAAVFLYTSRQLADAKARAHELWKIPEDDVSTPTWELPGGLGAPYTFSGEGEPGAPLESVGGSATDNPPVPPADGPAENTGRGPELHHRAPSLGAMPVVSEGGDPAWVPGRSGSTISSDVTAAPPYLGAFLGQPIAVFQGGPPADRPTGNTGSGPEVLHHRAPSLGARTRSSSNSSSSSTFAASISSGMSTAASDTTDGPSYLRPLRGRRRIP